MPTPPLSDELCDEAYRLVREHGTVGAAATATGINRGTLRNRYQTALESGEVLQWRQPILCHCVAFERRSKRPAKAPPKSL